MFVYHYRIFDRYNQQVISLVVLADDHADSNTLKEIQQKMLS